MTAGIILSKCEIPVIVHFSGFFLNCVSGVFELGLFLLEILSV